MKEKKPSRSKGSRSELTGLPPRAGSLEALLRKDFLANGAGVIGVVRRKHPTIYLRLIADVLPQELSKSAIELGAIGDEELFEIIKDLRARVAASAPDGGRAGPDKT
jgi:hypothetical protein